MGFTKLEKIAGLGGLASLGAVYLGKLASSPNVVTGGIITGSVCLATLIVSHVKECYQETRRINSEYPILRQDVINRIEELGNNGEKSYYKKLVDEADKVGGFK